MIQFLAGAPELLARYRNAPPAAAALISAAMDARRLGMGAGLPQAFLEAAAPGYLTDAQWDQLGEDWLEQALAYAAVPCKGARGPLTRIRPRPASRAARHRGDQPASMTAAAGPLYRLADYLDQHGRAHRASQIPPAEFWSAAAAHAAPGDQAALGDAAHGRGLYRYAAALWTAAVTLGSAGAAGQLIGLLRLVSHGDTTRAARWAVGHASLDDPWAILWLLRTLREAGAGDAVTTLLARDPARHADVNHPQVVFEWLGALRAAGDDDAATALATRAAGYVSLENTGTVAVLLKMLRQVGVGDAVTTLLARDPASHAGLHDPWAVAWLLGALRAAGDGDAVTTLLARDPASHARLDNPDAVAELLRELRTVGAGDAVTTWLARIDAVTTLLARDPASHARLDNPQAVAQLLRELRAAGDGDAATALTTRAAGHVSLDDPQAVAGLLGMLRQVGDGDAVTTLLARDPASHTSLDDPWGVDVLLRELRAAGADDAATALAIRAADHVSLDDPRAVDMLLRELRAAEVGDAVTTLLARDPASHAHLDNSWAVAELLRALREAGADDAATALAGQAANAGMFDLFLEVCPDEASSYPFGREPDGTPSQTWNWIEPARPKLTVPPQNTAALKSPPSKTTPVKSRFRPCQDLDLTGGQLGGAR